MKATHRSKSLFPWQVLKAKGYQGPESFERVWAYLPDELLEDYLAMGGPADCYYSENAHPLRMAFQAWDSRKALLLMQYNLQAQTMTPSSQSRGRAARLEPRWFSLFDEPLYMKEASLDALQEILSDLLTRGISFQQTDEQHQSVLFKLWLSHCNLWSSFDETHAQKIIQVTEIFLHQGVSIEEEDMAALLTLFPSSQYDPQFFKTVLQRFWEQQHLQHILPHVSNSSPTLKHRL